MKVQFLILLEEYSYLYPAALCSGVALGGAWGIIYRDGIRPNPGLLQAKQEPILLSSLLGATNLSISS